MAVPELWTLADFAFMDDYTLLIFGLPALMLAGVSVIVLVFLRSRRKEGIRPLQVTEKDRMQFREIRRDLNIWRFSARLLGGFGVLALGAGMMSIFGLDSSGKIDWRGSIVCFVFGGIFILPAILVARRDRLSK